MIVNIAVTLLQRTKTHPSINLSDMFSFRLNSKFTYILDTKHKIYIVRIDTCKK